MKEKLEPLIKRLREISSEIGALRGIPETAEDGLDAASESIHDAIDELQEVIANH